MAKREYKSVSQHLGQFSSPRTKQTYLSGITAFFKFLNPELEDVDAYSLSYLKSHNQSHGGGGINMYRKLKKEGRFLGFICNLSDFLNDQKLVKKTSKK